MNRAPDPLFVGDVKNDGNLLLGTTGGMLNGEWTAPTRARYGASRPTAAEPPGASPRLIPRALPQAISRAATP
jgi:hypothetical protein